MNKKTSQSKTTKKKKLGITDVVLRDAHQSLLATRLRTEDMLPIAEKLNKVGFWSLESWGGATFDACIRYLGEDPWERIRAFKKAMPDTPQQMLLRGQNLLGYRHYADDVVIRFVERAAANGVDVFRVFDAMNDTRNLQTALKAVIDTGKHAQGTISYTLSPVHTIQTWLDLGRQIEDLGAHSLAIKDMAGLLAPYVAEELVGKLKQSLSIPIHMQCHATTGYSVPTILKAVEAGIDNVDTAISSMSMTYGHSPTETIVASFADTPYDTGLDLDLLQEIALYFRDVRRRYAAFEGSLRGVDARILTAQVPGGMLTNLENQLREQNASDRFDEVLEEIPAVRKDLGYIPLVTPTSQIVGTQSVINVLSGERYKTLTREVTGVLRGEYGATPAEVDQQLQQRALDGDEPVTARPADLLKPELDELTEEFNSKCSDEGIDIPEDQGEQMLTYAMFPQVGWQFICNRDNPEAFETAPGEEPPPPAAQQTTRPATQSGVYNVRVDGRQFTVEVSDSGATVTTPMATPQATEAASASASTVTAPMAGDIVKIVVSEGQQVSSGTPLLILEAMKMETEVVADRDGQVTAILTQPGSKVQVGDALIQLD